MKTPSLKELKEHFKNAKTVICLEDKDEYILNFSERIEKFRNSILLYDQLETNNQDSNPSCCYIWNEDYGYAEITSYKKPIRTNKLTELEKRVEVLEHKVDLKKIADMPFNPELKQTFKGTKYESLLKAIKEGKILIPKNINIIEELKNYKPMSLNVGLDFGYGFMQPHLSDSFGIFQQYETLKQENNKLKLRVEELEAENKALLSAPNSGTISFTASSGFSVNNDSDKIVKDLEVGKWYKGSKDFNSLIYIERIKDQIHYNEIHCYGFWLDGWKKGYIANTSHEKSLIEANESEVFEALKNEAVKRGFGPRVFIKDCGSTQQGVFFYHYKYNYLYCGNYSVFMDGKWAELAPSIFKEQAEKELGKKII